jgi:hypothetical protein
MPEVRVFGDIHKQEMQEVLLGMRLARAMRLLVAVM